MTLDSLRTALADRYRIERELGAGGMATVYLAQDLKHDRKVAIKVLRPELAAVIGAERFLAEIRTTANLQHPHILPLFDSGEVGGRLYYVMPFVAGESLRDRLSREQQLPVADAVRIAGEVASALDSAHRQGVVHRDIKPENILLHDGRALVADFGIALAVRASDTNNRMTETGMSLGTPHYMSPEQAMGEREITARSDVYALGAITYEMLAGEPPFTGPTAQAIVARVMTEAPRSLSAQRRSVPVNVEAAIFTALEKLPADRMASAGAFAAALTNPGYRHAAGSIREAGSGPVAGRPLNRWVVAATAIGLVAAGLLLGRAMPPGSEDARDVGLPADAPMSMFGWDRQFAVAADGSFMVYVAAVNGTTQLYRRDLAGQGFEPIAGTEGATGLPLLSPDARRVAFGNGEELRVVDVAGGASSAVVDIGVNFWGAWIATDRILVSDLDGRRLRWLDPEGGLIREANTEYCQLPTLISAGERLLCGGGADKYASVRYLDDPAIKHPFRRAAGSGETGALVLGSDFRLVADRYLVYLSLDGTLMGTMVRDLDSLWVGRSVPLVPLVRRSVYLGAGGYDLTADGSLVYLPGVNAEVGHLVQRTRDGRETMLNVPAAAHLRFTPSPDGRRIATVTEGVGRQELRVHDLGNGTAQSIDAGFYVSAPSWSPDGTRLVYRVDTAPGEERLVVRRLDSPEMPRELLPGSGTLVIQPSSWLADDFLLVGAGTNAAQALLLDPTTTPTGVDSLGFSSFFTSISPDRRWIAIQNQGGGGIRLQPWPARDRVYQVDARAIEPRWRSATELAFQMPGASAIHQVTINPASGSPVGARRPVVEDRRFVDTPGWSFAFTSTGELIYLQSPAGDEGHYLRVVPDWVAQMKRAVDGANP